MVFLIMCFLKSKAWFISNTISVLSVFIFCVSDNTGLDKVYECVLYLVPVQVAWSIGDSDALLNTNI